MVPTNLNFLRTSSDSLAGIVTASINLRRPSSERANAVHCTLAIKIADLRVAPQDRLDDKLCVNYKSCRQEAGQHAKIQVEHTVWRHASHSQGVLSLSTLIARLSANFRLRSTVDSQIGMTLQIGQTCLGVHKLLTSNNPAVFMGSKW